MPLGERRRTPRTSRQLIATTVDIHNHAYCNVNSELPTDIWLKLRENPCLFFFRSVMIKASKTVTIKAISYQPPLPSFSPTIDFFLLAIISQGTG